MNRAADTVDLLWEMSDARQSETRFEKRTRDQIERVSNNLGVYFLFCLFGLAILALFLCRSMQALQASLFFFVLRSQVWQVFMYQ